MGFRVAAVSSGPAKEAIARELGAQEYIDASAADPGKALAALGGAHWWPERGIGPAVPTDPVLYRLYEVRGVLRVCGKG